MSLGNSLKKGAITLGLLAISGNEQRTDEDVQDVNSNLRLKEVIKAEKDQILEVVLSKNVPRDDTTCYSFLEILQNTLNTQKEIVIKRPLGELFEKDKDSKRQNPLTVGVRKTFGELVGYNQADSIIKNYNQTRAGITAMTTYKITDTLCFPLIYPELKEKFSTTLHEELNQKPYFEVSSVEDTIKQYIIIKNVGGGKQALALYDTNKPKNQLFLTTYVSIGREKSTPNGTHQAINHIKYGYSNTYNAPMPYAILFKGSKYLLHQGKVDGTPLSHGCVRVPGAYQEIIYHLVEKGTPIVIDKNVYKAE